LTNQLVQQERLVSKGTSALTDLINNKKPADTTKTVLPTTRRKPKKKREVKPKQHLSLMVYLIKEKSGEYYNSK
jgi:hypothetical protein